MSSHKKLIMIFGMILSLSYVYADAEKGQKVYMKVCKDCHGKADKTAASHTTDEWAELFNDEAIEIIESHEKSGAKKFFNSPQFKKRIPHLKDFFEMYGSDSGNIPPC